MGTQLPTPKRGRSPPIFGPSVVAKWLHRLRCHALGVEVGLRPGDFVFDGDLAPLPKKGAEPPPQIFGPCPLWPNGWMDQEGTCHGGGPWCMPHCVRWGRHPAPLPKKGAEPPRSPIFGPFLLWPNGWMHQDATLYGGRPGPKRHCVTWGLSYSPLKKRNSPQFSAHVYCD